VDREGGGDWRLFVFVGHQCPTYSNGWHYMGCRGLPLLVVGGETPARAKDKPKAA